MTRRPRILVTPWRRVLPTYLGERTVPDALDSAAGLPGEAILAARHPVQVVAGSRLHAALGTDALEVNTIHPHAIADPGELAVTARAPGGVVEAIEPQDGWAALGVQWHPEKREDPLQRALFADLVARARDRAGVPA